MGCLMFTLEFLIDEIITGWFFLMEWIIPEKYISNTLRIVLKIIVLIFSGILFVLMILGIFAIISDDVFTKQIGRYLLFIPLGISAVQILFGAVIRLISKKKE